MNNQKIKVGDWVEYVGRPDEKFLVEKSVGYGDDYPYAIMQDGIDFAFNEYGKMYEKDTQPIVKLTTPPKKKVFVEFDVYTNTIPDRLHGGNGLIYTRMTDKCKLKAKLIIEVEE